MRSSSSSSSDTQGRKGEGLDHVEYRRADTVDTTPKHTFVALAETQRALGEDGHANGELKARRAVSPVR